MNTTKTSTKLSVANNGRLKGKTAFVTGASSGIGEATAIAMAQEGARVAVVARRTDRLKELTERFDKDAMVALAADVSDGAQAKQAVEKAVAELGGIDILVNNAGIMILGPFDEVPIEDWERMVNLNVLGVMYCTHAAIPHMKSRGGGDIVNISSVAGRVVSGPGVVYHATKWALGAFSEGIRQQYVSNNIRVTCIEPGAVLTELTDHISHDATKQQIKDWVKSMDPLKSEDIAAGIMYAITQPAHVSVNEILIRPTNQAH